MDDRTELTEAERDALWGATPLYPYEATRLEPAVERIVAARVSALSRDLAAQNTRIAAVEATVASARVIAHAGGDQERRHYAGVWADRFQRALSVSDPGQDKERCTTPGCPGDYRYAAPGRNHITGCHYPAEGVRRG